MHLTASAPQMEIGNLVLLHSPQTDSRLRAAKLLFNLQFARCNAQKNEISIIVTRSKNYLELHTLVVQGSIEIFGDSHVNSCVKMT